MENPSKIYPKSITNLWQINENEGLGRRSPLRGGPGASGRPTRKTLGLFGALLAENGIQKVPF